MDKTFNLRTGSWTLKEKELKDLLGKENYSANHIFAFKNHCTNAEAKLKEKGDELRLRKGSSSVEGEEARRSNRNGSSDVRTETVGILRERGDGNGRRRPAFEPKR
ncbi:uncharacterized protein E6C27_scaffold131G001440 [Cucumis melo var. makuwa]|uniref:Uncharacterized protein n=1 Tax=Cucumis melo var. makuwa TaxID=1194695 RepID=A0A5A7UI22_CUCMM|nr:uncharacterized protein E6C27_scaffold131G001440 [Cucumis melo var. makuwa]